MRSLIYVALQRGQCDLRVFSHTCRQAFAFQKVVRSIAIVEGTALSRSITLNQMYPWGGRMDLFCSLFMLALHGGTGESAARAFTIHGEEFLS